MIEGRPHRKIPLDRSWRTFKEILMRINKNLLNSLKSCLFFIFMQKQADLTLAQW